MTTERLPHNQRRRHTKDGCGREMTRIKKRWHCPVHGECHFDETEPVSTTIPEAALTRESLLAAGYHFHQPAMPWKNSDGFFQKRIKCGDETLYFVNILWYDRTKYATELAPDGWQPEVQFRNAVGTFNVDLIGVDSLEAIEQFFQGVYEKMECKAYDDE